MSNSFLQVSSMYCLLETNLRMLVSRYFNFCCCVRFWHQNKSEQLSSLGVALYLLDYLLILLLLNYILFILDYKLTLLLLNYILYLLDYLSINFIIIKLYIIYILDKLLTLLLLNYILYIVDYLLALLLLNYILYLLDYL